jgi:hypothetical protein
MTYSKTNWIDRAVQYPQRFTRTSDGTYDTLVPAPGTITTAGTPLTAAALNNLESQYDSVMYDINSMTVGPTRVTPSYLNGWVDNSASYPSYFSVDKTGTVHLYIHAKSGGTTVNTVIANLPGGYRPASAMTFNGYGDPGVDIIWHITTTGEIKFLRTFSITDGNFIILRATYKAAT